MKQASCRSIAVALLGLAAVCGIQAQAVYGFPAQLASPNGEGDSLAMFGALCAVALWRRRRNATS